MKQVTRVPAIDPDGKPLMPTTPARARKWIASGKAVGKRNKLGVFYVQLTQLPSGYKTQPIVARNFWGEASPQKMPWEQIEEKHLQVSLFNQN